MTRRKVRKPEKRNQERYAVTVQLIIGIDDDLIERIKSIPSGNRQAALKTVLYQAADLPEPIQTPPSNAALSTDVERRLSSMQAQLDDIHTGGVDNSSRDIQELRQELNTLKETLQRINAAIASGSMQSLVIDDDPTVDADTLARRNRRLRNTNW